jgi:hypothetical protein
MEKKKKELTAVDIQTSREGIRDIGDNYKPV